MYECTSVPTYQDHASFGPKPALQLSPVNLQSAVSPLLPDGREKFSPVVEDGLRLQLVHQGREDSSLELLPEVFPTSIPKFLAGSDAVPVNLDGLDILHQVDGTLSLEDTPQKQLKILSSPADSAGLLGRGYGDVLGERRTVECKLDQPREVNEGNLVGDILDTRLTYK